MNKIVIGFIAVAVVMVAIPILLAWSGTKRRPRVQRVDGVAELHMPRGHWTVLAVLALLPAAAITGLSLAVDWKPGAEAGRWVLAGVFGVAGLVASGYLFGLELRGRLRFGEDTIEKVGVFSRVSARWSDVVKLTFNPANNWFFLTLAAGPRIYVTEGHSGLGDFAELALRHLPRPVLEASPDAVEALEDAASLVITGLGRPRGWAAVRPCCGAAVRPTAPIAATSSCPSPPSPRRRRRSSGTRW